MRHVPFERPQLRCARFERCEDRLVFSSIPWADVCFPRIPDLESPLPDWHQIAPAFSSTSSGTSYVRETYGFQGQGQTVAVIDSGIAYDHLALGAGLGDAFQVVGGWDFTEENDADPHDDGPAGFHGTHVAGIIGSRDLTRPGIAPGVDLVALRVFNDMGLGYARWVEEALQWVHEHQNDFRYPITTVNMSLGSDFNGSAPPSWGVFEDELAALKEDGMFIAVAAGNKFADYRVPGLAYPAASPHVVPVASVKSDGQLSEYSQRLQRALAAPGEKITSTVPDHIFGVDGYPNDWATVSGTSMAAPYVAGASVLVREALQFVGHTSVDQADIYQHLRDAANVMSDPATNSMYYRVNLAATIDALMPDDDYGSRAAEAFDLGTLFQTRTVSGQIARLDDRDFFQFTAAASGEMTLDLSATAGATLTLISDADILERQPERFRFRVEAGSRYTFSVAGEDRLTKYDLQMAGTPDNFVQIDNGVVRVDGTADADLIEFSVGSQYRLVVNGQVHAFDRDEPLRFEIVGGGGQDSLTVRGSSGNDVVVLRAGSADMTGDSYTFHADGFPRIVAIAGEGNNDVARFHGSAGNDEYVGRPGQSEMRGAGFHNVASGFDRTYAHASAGDDDMARFFDSAGNDQFIFRPHGACMRGTGFFNMAIGFDRLYANASAGNDDVARFFDSTGNDEFVGRATTSSLRGPGYHGEAAGFDRVFAYASSGRNDVARLFDTPGNDQFTGGRYSSGLRGAGYHNQAINFDRVYAYASTGTDVAHLTGSTGNNRFYALGARQILMGDRYYNEVRGFDRTSVNSLASSGDVAFLYNTPSPDTYCAFPTHSLWQGAEFHVDLRGFRRIYATGTQSGNDTARVQIGSQSAQFLGRGDTAVAVDGQTRHELRGFQRVTLDVADGSLSALYLSALDFLFERIGRSV